MKRRRFGVAEPAESGLVFSAPGWAEERNIDMLGEMRELKFDLAAVKSMDDFHERAVDVFKFPDYYGRNRDAFWDCLTDVIEPTNVVILNHDKLALQLRDSVNEYLKMFEEYQEKTKGEFTFCYR